MAGGTVRIELERADYQPGEEIRGRVAWSSGERVMQLSVRLFWRTEGKGTGDRGTVEVLDFDEPGPDGERGFLLRAPEWPVSFSGELISLVWSVEAVLRPGGTARADVVVAPAGVELDLRRPEWLVTESTGGSVSKWVEALRMRKQ